MLDGYNLGTKHSLAGGLDCVKGYEAMLKPCLPCLSSMQTGMHTIQLTCAKY